MRTLGLIVTCTAVSLLVGTIATAQITDLTQIDTHSTAVAVRDPAGPLSAQQITQNVVPDTIVDGTSVACVSAYTVEHSWWRLFDLDDDHGLTGEFCVESIDWATQSLYGNSMNLTINVYCLDEGLPFALQNLTLQDSAVVPLTAEQLVFHNTAVGGCCDSATQDVAVELLSEDCNVVDCVTYFVGMNDLGQTGPSYIHSFSCGMTNPADLASLGFPNAHLIMVVNGADETPSDDGGDDPDVPATSVGGLAVLLLTVLGTSVYFVRRRAEG